MKLSLITNNVDIAQIAEASGIDRIIIDLERRGKAKRQFGRKLFISDHLTFDIECVRRVLSRSELMVRIDPLHAQSSSQIKIAIESGANLIMLPYFHRLEEAQEFIDIINGRALPVLLVETIDSVNILKNLTELPGLSEVHVGLNDLSISLGLDNIFELILDGTIDAISAILRVSNVPFGFGGIGSLDRLDLPVNPELILAEQVIQGATRGWLGRSFRDIDMKNIPSNINAIRNKIQYWNSASDKEKLIARQRLRLHLENMLCKK